MAGEDASRNSCPELCPGARQLGGRWVGAVGAQSPGWHGSGPGSGSRLPLPDTPSTPPLQAKTKGLQSGVDIGVKYSEKQERNFDDATMKAGQCVIGLQVGAHGLQPCARHGGVGSAGGTQGLSSPVPPQVRGRI